MGVKVGHKGPSRDELLFTYLPNYSDVNKITIENNSIGNSQSVDSNQTNLPTGKLLGVNHTVTEDDDDLEYYNGSNSSLYVSNNNGLYNYGTTPTIYNISYWVKINRFPTRNSSYTKGENVAKKRMSFIKLVYDTINFEMGAMGPHYIYNNTPVYQGVYVPISFTFTRYDPSSHTIPPYSFYTDYLYELNTWYFITISITLSGLVRIYVNNTQKSIAFANNKIITNHGSHGSQWFNADVTSDFQTQRTGKSSRANSQVAAGPNFIARDGTQKISSLVMSFDSVPSLEILKSIHFTPLLLANPSYRNITGINTGVDFGQFTIYKNSYNNDLYNSQKNFYI